MFFFFFLLHILFILATYILHNTCINFSCFLSHCFIMIVYRILRANYGFISSLSMHAMHGTLIQTVIVFQQKHKNCAKHACIKANIFVYTLVRALATISYCVSPVVAHIKYLKNLIKYSMLFTNTTIRKKKEL